jgi:predicted phosphodiesterase
MKAIAADAPQHTLRALLDAEAANVLIVGHTHVPFVRRLANDKLVVNPGALLRDGGPNVDVPTPGTFGILEVAYEHATFEIHRAVSSRQRSSSAR